MTTATLTLQQMFDTGMEYNAKGLFTEAIEIFSSILKEQPRNSAAAVGLANSLLPGINYLENLKKFHDLIKPLSYVEIGVESGASLKLASPPSVAVGIDPKPQIQHEFSAETHVFPLKSDDFFEQHHLPEIIGRELVDMAFIDGMHLFEYTLKDFINIEKFSHKDTVVLLHDCYPISAITSLRERQTDFWSGDCWKALACLKKYRPDLTCFTIKASPTGLGVVTGLDPANTVLQDNWDDIIDEYTYMLYDSIEDDRDSALNAVENNWDVVLKELRIKN